MPSTRNGWIAESFLPEAPISSLAQHTAHGFRSPSHRMDLMLPLVSVGCTWCSARFSLCWNASCSVLFCSCCLGLFATRTCAWLPWVGAITGSKLFILLRVRSYWMSQVMYPSGAAPHSPGVGPTYLSSYSTLRPMATPQVCRGSLSRGAVVRRNRPTCPIAVSLLELGLHV